MKEVIKAVRRDEIINLIDDETLKSAFERNEIRCERCNDIVTKENLGTIKRENGRLIFICDKYECIKES